jgi:hypothetical protein
MKWTQKSRFFLHCGVLYSWICDVKRNMFVVMMLSCYTVWLSKDSFHLYCQAFKSLVSFFFCVSYAKFCILCSLSLLLVVIWGSVLIFQGPKIFMENTHLLKWYMCDRISKRVSHQDLFIFLDFSIQTKYAIYSVLHYLTSLTTPGNIYKSKVTHYLIFFIFCMIQIFKVHTLSLAFCLCRLKIMFICQNKKPCFIFSF